MFGVKYQVQTVGDRGQVSETDSGFQRELTRADGGGEGSARMPWPPSRGVLHLSRYVAGGAASSPAVHRSTFVNGPDYCGMTDNDIRGFLDGGFIWGWNQATQIHVRLGRTGEFPNPKYGEVELFRVLQRWDDHGPPSDPDRPRHDCTRFWMIGPPMDQDRPAPTR